MTLNLDSIRCFRFELNLNLISSPGNWNPFIVAQKSGSETKSRQDNGQDTKEHCGPQRELMSKSRDAAAGINLARARIWWLIYELCFEKSNTLLSSSVLLLLPSVQQQQQQVGEAR